MKKLFIVTLLILGSVYIANAQDTNLPAKSDNSIAHKVAMGETVMLIARKYRVTPQDIYDLNPDAVNGINSNTMLTIPSSKNIAHKPKESHRDVADVKIYMEANRVYRE